MLTLFSTIFFVLILFEAFAMQRCVIFNRAPSSILEFRLVITPLEAHTFEQSPKMTTLRLPDFISLNTLYGFVDFLGTNKR